MRTTFLATGAILIGILGTSAYAHDGPNGVWRGAYSCRGTPIGLKLSIRDAGRDQFTARATFSPPGSPVPGEYELIGTIDPASGILRLRYTRWITRVPGFAMAALLVAPDRDGKHLRGNVVFSGCDEPFILAYGGPAEVDVGTEPPAKPLYPPRRPGPSVDRSTPNRSTSEAPANPSVDALNASPVSGTWDGRLTCGRTTSDIVLSVRPTTAQVSEAVLETYAADALLRPVPHLPMVLRQEESTNQFRFVPKSASDQLRFDATLSENQNELSATSPTCGAFILHRHVSAQNGPAPRSLGEGKTIYNSSDGLSKRCQALSRWAGKLSREYPSMDMHHTVFGLIYPKAVLLFNDDDFVPVFGFRYDRAVNLDLTGPGVDDASRRALQDAYEDVLSKCATDPFIRTEGQWIWGSGIFQKSLFARPNPWWESSYYGGDFAIAAIRHFVQIARQKRRDFRNRLEAAKGNFTNFLAGKTKINEMLSALSQDEAYAWPSELASARADLSGNLNKMAAAEGERVLHQAAIISDPLQSLKFISTNLEGDPSGILSSMAPNARATFEGHLKETKHELASTIVKPILDRVQSTEVSLSGAKTLTIISSQSAPIFAMFTEADRRESSAVIAKKLDLILAELVQADLSELRSFPGGSTGLGRSASWERAYNQKYSDYVSSAPVKEGRIVFLKDRATRLATSVPEAEAILAHMDFRNPTAKAQATEALQRFLCWSGDGSLPESLEYDFLAAKFEFDSPVR